MTTATLINLIKNAKDDEFDIIKHVKNVGYFMVYEYNNLPIYVLEKDDEKLLINVTRLHSITNYVKNADNCARSWFNQTILKSHGFERWLEHERYSVKGFAGDYVAIERLELLIGLIGKGSLLGWFDGHEDWDENDNIEQNQFMYLIQLPSHNGTCIYKCGKTTCLLFRFRTYLNHFEEELRKLGIKILALARVVNTSAAEQACGSVFTDPRDGCRLADGNEYYYVPGNGDVSSWVIAQNLFECAISNLLASDDDIKFYEPGENVFRLDKDIEKFGFDDTFKNFDA